MSPPNRPELSVARGVMVLLLVVLPSVEVTPGAAAQGCDGCRLQASEIVRFGDPAGPGAIENDIVGITQDARGRYYVYAPQGQAIQVYDADGGYLRRIGQRGEGPGEFRAIQTVVVGPGDSLYVFDVRLGRLSVFSSSYSLVRTAALDYAPGFEILWQGDGMVMASQVGTLERAGLPVHLLDRSGRIRASFGSADRGFRPDYATSGQRAIALSSGGLVWSGHRYRYELELWSADNTLVRRLNREVDWFPDPHSGRQPARQTPAPPEPFLHVVREEADQLWVVTVIADPNWERAIRHTPGAIHPEVLDLRGYQDSVVELLDSRTGELVAGLRLDDPVMAILAGARAAVMVEGPDGTPAISVRQLRLVPPSR